MDLRLGRYHDVLADIECDAVICDPPYSERTHSGHRDGVSSASRAHTRTDRRNGAVYGGGGVNRRTLSYGAWSQDDVVELCEWAHARCRGWIVLIVDHIEARWAEDALSDLGRYTFAPLPAVEIGRTVRLTGDGPSSWTSWVVAARPRNSEFARWGTLPGAYVSRGGPKQGRHIGGKPIELMRELVRDYSRPGEVVCDPCAGYGTTLLAAILEGRRAVGAEVDPETHARAQGEGAPEGVGQLDLWKVSP